MNRRGEKEIGWIHVNSWLVCELCWELPKKKRCYQIVFFANLVFMPDFYGMMILHACTLVHYPLAMATLGGIIIMSCDLDGSCDSYSR